VAPAVASFIVQSIHSIRKTLPMQMYVSFQIDSTGLMKVDDLTLHNISNDDCEIDAAAFDQGIRDASSCLLRCGTAKVLPMLEALFSVLLKKTIELNDETISVQVLQSNIFQARAVLSMLAVFSLDLRRSVVDDASIFQYLSGNFSDLVVHSISRFLMNCYSLDADKMFPNESLLRPIVALFSSELLLIGQVFKYLTSGLDAEKKSTSIAPVLEVWLKIIKTQQLSVAIQRIGAGMIPHAKQIKSETKVEAERKVAGRILAELEMLSDPTFPLKGYHEG